MTLPTQIAILGAAGRMGRALIDALPAHPSLRLGAAFDRAEASRPAVKPHRACR